MTALQQIADRVAMSPLMLRPDQADALVVLQRDQAAMLFGFEERPTSARAVYTVERGVARIPVNGTLVHKLGGVAPWRGLVGYDCLDRVIADARANKAVRAILLDIDSPGGEVAGCFALAEKIRRRSARFGGKPIVAFANEMACSAAYAIACSCDAVMTTRTGVVGSIGVWRMLVDQTKALAQGGIAVRMVRAGDRKARGGPFETPDAATVAKVQDHVDDTWQLFARQVAASRPISTHAVLKLAGDWYSAAQALDLGLVDAVDDVGAVFEAVVGLGR
jgi:signal peptide peptidase SppA